MVAQLGCDIRAKAAQFRGVPPLLQDNPGCLLVWFHGVRDFRPLWLKERGHHEHCRWRNDADLLRVARSQRRFHWATNALLLALQGEFLLQEVQLPLVHREGASQHLQLPLLPALHVQAPRLRAHCLVRRAPGLPVLLDDGAELPRPGVHRLAQPVADSITELGGVLQPAVHCSRDSAHVHVYRLGRRQRSAGPLWYLNDHSHLLACDDKPGHYLLLGHPPLLPDCDQVLLHAQAQVDDMLGCNVAQTFGFGMVR